MSVEMKFAPSPDIKKYELLVAVLILLPQQDRGIYSAREWDYNLTTTGIYTKMGQSSVYCWADSLVSMRPLRNLFFYCLINSNIQNFCNIHIIYKFGGWVSLTSDPVQNTLTRYQQNVKNGLTYHRSFFCVTSWPSSAAQFSDIYLSSYSSIIGMSYWCGVFLVQLQQKKT